MERRKAILATAVAGAVALIPAGGPAGAQSGPPIVEAARQVTTDVGIDRSFVSPVIAVDPRNSLNVVVGAADARNGGCRLRASRDGGLSWVTTAETLMPAELPYCVQRTFGPVMEIAFASNGVLYAGMSGTSTETGHPNGPASALAARATDLGGSHETVTVAEANTGSYTLPDGSTAAGYEILKLNSLAVDPSDPDRLYRGWRMMIRGVEQAPVPGSAMGGIPVRGFMSSSSDGGRNWTEPVDVLAAAGIDVSGSDYPAMVVGKDGAIHAFVKEQPARPPQGQPSPKARFFMATSTDHGATWEGRAIHDGEVRIGAPRPAIDHGNGNIYLTWEQQGASRELPSNVMLMRSTDGGRTWSEPLNITDDDPAKGMNQYVPGISVAPNGRVDVAWQDFRNDPFYAAGTATDHASPERYADIYYAYSTDGGASFSRNIRVTDRSIDRSVGVTFNNQDIRGPVGVASTNYAALFAWTDSRAGTPLTDAEDAYFTRARFAASPLGAASSDAAEGWWVLLGVGIALAAGGAALLLFVRRGGPFQPASRPT